MQFLPILNFNFGQSNVLSAAEITYVYLSSLNAIKPYSDEVEISIVSDSFWENLPELINCAQELGLRLSFGSLSSLDAIRDLDSKLQEFRLGYPVKIFAPAYDEEIAQYLSCKQDYEYIPGLTKITELNQERVSAIKIFPCEHFDAESLLKFMQAPYPELRKEIYHKKILLLSADLYDKYQFANRLKQEDENTILESKSNNEKIYCVTCPYDYQKIRSKFLSQANIKICIYAQKLDLTALWGEIRERTRMPIYATGLQNLDAAKLNTLASQGIDIVATRVFKTIVLDLLAGHIDQIALVPLMQAEMQRRTGIQTP